MIKSNLGFSWGAWFLLIAGLVDLAPRNRAEAGSPPEVVRVRIPAARASTVWPAGTTLRTMRVDELDALLAKAQANQARSTPPRCPVRIEHVATWDGANLVGRSRVSLPATATEPVQIPLDPWSPAVLDADDRANFARVDPAGRFLLAQPPNQPARVVEIPWRQAALADSKGHAFALYLPTADVASLVLDLPAALIPTANAAAPGSRRGPEPTPGTDQARWELGGASGWFPVQLQDRFDDARSPRLIWVGGPTRIDLAAPGANWVAEWQVERTSGSPANLQVDLDPGLELIDLTGPEVRSSQAVGPDPADPSTGRTRWQVQLQDLEANRPQSTTIALRGRVEPPLAGRWLIPSAWPVGATWVGGRTEVRLDPLQVITGMSERAGRQAIPRSSEPATASTLAFESTASPGPVAELDVARPEVDASVAIDGTLRIGPFAPRIEVTAVWTLDRRRLFDPTLDFPPGWVVERVAGAQGQAPGAWHVEALPGVGQRLHLDGSTWNAEPTGRTVSLTIAAIRVEPDRATLADPLALPRVRPAVGPVRTADERWTVLVDPGWEIEPTSSRGLVWTDPASPPIPAPGRNGEGDIEPVAALDAAGSGQRLAWRWLESDAAATVARVRCPGRPQVDERLEASVVAGRLRLVWFWSIAEAGRPDSLPFQVDLEGATMPRWRLLDRSGGQVIDPRAIDPAQRLGAGFGATGLAAELDLTRCAPGPLTIRGEAEIAWRGTGSIPSIRFADSVDVRRSVVIQVEPTTRFRVDRSEGWTVVARGTDRDSAGGGAGAEVVPPRLLDGEPATGLRVAAAWVGSDRPTRLEVTTANDLGVGSLQGQGIITEASLISRLAPGSMARHRLLLRVAPGSGRTLDLRLPAGATLDRLRRDGQPTVASGDGATLRIDLAPTDPTRPTVTITLDYRTAAAPLGIGRVQPANLLPATTLPCLGFNWQVNAPERFTIRSDSPDLVVSDLIDQADSASAADLAEFAVDLDAEGPIVSAMLADLNAALLDAPPLETTLGDWLLRLDAGRWPLVLDRLALQSIGWGPRSRINVAEPEPGRPLTAAAAFHALGLTVEPLGATFLISTEADQRIEHRQADLSARARLALGQALFQVVIAGADRSDRYQTPSRWLSEPTPRAWLASETPDRGLVATGWRLHRFTAVTWPTSAMAIRLADPRAGWREAGLIAAGIATLALFVAVSRTSPRQRVRQSLVLTTGLVGLTGSAWARFDGGAGEPIVVVLPYEDLAQIGGGSDPVILAQADHDRLVRLAHPGPPGGPGATNSLATTHHVAALVGQVVVVETRQTLEVADPGGGSWSFPVGPGFELSATLDGRPAPLRISPDGRLAVVGSIPAGRSTVVFRRSVAVRTALGGSVGGTIQVPVGRSPFARVEVATGAGLAPVVLLDLAGGLVVRPDAVVGELGPREWIKVRWGSAPTGPTNEPELAAAILWDARAAGDRVVARLKVAGTTPLATLRLKLEPGLAVVAPAIPGLVGSGVAPGSDEWVAHIDPPLEPGRSCELVFWRPALGPAALASRALPRWEVVHGRMQGVVGFRQPADGVGGLAQGPGADPMTAAEFDRAWGRRPTEDLTLAGVTRWDPARSIVARLGPEPSRRGVRDAVEVEVAPGGLRFVAKSVFTGPFGLGWVSDATFDGPVRLVRVEAAGLTSWSQPRPDQVHLVFDGSGSGLDRSIRLHGWVDLVAADRAISASRLTALVPWPRWSGAEAAPATLVVVGAEGVEVRAGERKLDPEPDPLDLPGSVPSPARRSYAISRGDPPVRVGWIAPPARVNVAIESDLRLDPDQAVWTAQVVAEVAGGPVETLYWKVPTLWAEGATLTSPDGDAPQVQADVQGEATLWTISLGRAIWHRRTLVIRSSRPLKPGTLLDYPEIAPLSAPGRGSVAGYNLAITNLTGVELQTMATGLTVVNPARVQPELAQVLRATSSRTFRVADKLWSLRLRLNLPEGAGGGVTSPRVGEFDDVARGARLESVDLRLAVDSTLRTQGRAEVWLEPGAAFLAVHLAERSALVGASVEGRPATPVAPRSDRTGRWLIPLADGNARRVVFGWIQPASPLDQEQRSPSVVVLPRFDQASVATSVRLATTAPDADPMIIGGTWTRLSPREASLGRFERWGDRVVAEARFSEGGPAAVATGSALIVETLVAMALELRGIERAGRVAGESPSGPPIESWRAITNRVESVLNESGMGNLLDQARERVGDAVSESEPGREGEPIENLDLFRARQIGEVWHFGGVTAEDPAQIASIANLLQAP